jgi:hypothetical protein
MSPRIWFPRLLTAAAHCAVRSRPLALLAAPLLAAPLLTAAPAQADSPASPGPASAAQVQALAKAHARAMMQTVTTLTGGQLQVRPGATGGVERSGPALSYTAPDGDRYLVPAAAAPYAGRQLAWSLFDISALARDHITNGAKIPVALSLTSPGAATPPGITLTSSAGRSARGYLTPSSTRKFAAFLRNQAAADVAAGRSVGATPLPGVARMTLAAAAPSQETGPQNAYLGVRQQSAFQVVTFKTPGLTGPASALIKLWNVDSFERLSIAINSFNGVAKVAVPAGNYFAVTQYIDFDAQGNPQNLRYVTAGFTIAGNPVTVHVNESKASTLSTPATPKPALQVNQFLTWGVQDATGGAFNAVTAIDWGPAGSDTQGQQGADIYVAPNKTGPPVGRLRYYVQWDGIAPPSGGSPLPFETSYPYRYDLAYGFDNQIPAAPYPVQADQLATVRDHVYSDPALTPPTFEFSKAPIDPVLPGSAAFAPADLWVRPAPGDFTDYVGTADGGDWTFVSSIGPPNALGFEDLTDPQAFAGGHSYSIDWGRGPLAPQWGQHAPRPPELFQTCAACATDSSGSDFVDAQYSTDSNDTQQADEGFRVQNDTGACYLNGTQIASFPACNDQENFSAPGQVNTYRLVMDTGPSSFGPAYSQSTPTHTDLTFQFQDKASPPADMTLPSGYECNEFPVSGACEVLPVLTLDYQLAENELGASDARVQRMNLDVGHETFDGIGSHAKITSASVQVSFDGGTTWQPAVLGGHDGHYIAHWHNPASARGTSPDLMVTATDAIGGSITQEIDNAYIISPTAR